MNKDILYCYNVFINQDILEDAINNNHFDNLDNINCFIDFLITEYL